jgi:antitoxin component YwqK of YwqJK toxin-antitoxin module
MKPRLIGWTIAFCLFAGVNGFGATARDLLASQYPQLRDLGSRLLLQSYVPPARENGDRLVAQLKLGMKESAVSNLLTSAGATNEPEGSADLFEKNYRLDDLWVVRCWFTNSAPGKAESVLTNTRLVEQMNRFGVEPPNGFSGDWTTYWANGQTNAVSHYFNGQLDGTITSYYSNGSKADVSSCRDGVLEGEATAYYPSGKVECKGQYRAGAQIGHWIWYDEDGKVESEKDFGK